MEIKKHITDLSGNKVTTPPGTAFRVDKIMKGEEWTKAQGKECDIDYYELAILVAEIGKTGKYRFILRRKCFADTLGVCNLKTD